jgi:hypothetical protein
VVLGLELRAFTLSHSCGPIFVKGFFQDRVSRTICLSWLRITRLLISASWVARITDVSHQHPAQSLIFLLALPLDCESSWKLVIAIISNSSAYHHSTCQENALEMFIKWKKSQLVALVL